MRIGVAGAGAVGGLMAARLAEAGHEVSLLARGATLDAVREHGLRLATGDDAAAETVAHPAVADDASALGPQDLLVVALKGTALARDAPQLAPMIGSETLVLPAMNGVPWWFLDPSGEGRAVPLASIDPLGRIAATLPRERTLGCVVHLTSSLLGPGRVRHGAGWRLVVGEPRGGLSARVAGIAEALEAGGFEVDQADDVRREIWYKLWGNMTVNPVSALTGASGDRILDDDLVRAFMVEAMAEAAEVGAGIGCPIEESGEERLGLARRLGAFRTSMLQDADAGREIELDALTGVVREIARRVGVPTPRTDALHGLARLMGSVRGLYDAGATGSP